jgi:phosphoribosylpyrophosphate synthetase
MKTNIIISTRAARHLLVGAKPIISKATEIIMPEPNKEGSYVFPDGELYFRVSGLKHTRRVVILHSGYPDPNGGLIELYMLLNIVRLYAPLAKINIVFASMPYARQDKAYYDGELNAAKTLIETLVKCYGVKWIWTIDAHFANERWLRGLPFTNITACTDHLIAEARHDHPEMILMAPDAGSNPQNAHQGSQEDANKFIQCQHRSRRDIC